MVINIIHRFSFIWLKMSKLLTVIFSSSMEGVATVTKKKQSIGYHQLHMDNASRLERIPIGPNITRAQVCAFYIPNYHTNLMTFTNLNKSNVWNSVPMIWLKYVGTFPCSKTTLSQGREQQSSMLSNIFLWFPDWSLQMFDIEKPTEKWNGV